MRRGEFEGIIMVNNSWTTPVHKKQNATLAQWNWSERGEKTERESKGMKREKRRERKDIGGREEGK